MSTSSSALSMIDGATSGTTPFNAQNYVNELIAAESGPETLMQQQVSTLSSQASALSSISTDLTSLQTAAVALNDYQGGLNANVANSSNSDVATGVADNTATAGTHTLSVSHLATIGSYYSGTVSSGTATIGQGTFTIQVGNGTVNTVTVDSSNDTLNQLAATINGDNLGVTATVVTDDSGARLSIVSNTSGSAGNLTVGNDTTGLGFTMGVQGVDASFTLDGVPLTSATNTVTGAVQGLTLNLTGTSSSPITIDVAPDTSAMTTAIQNFVTAYNQVVTDFNNQFTYNSSTDSTGPLGSDPVLMQVQQTILGDAAYSVSGNSGIVNLASIGVTMNDDGTLGVDTTQLNAALSSNPSAVINLFQQGSPPGVAQQFVNDLININDPVNGPLTVDQNSISSETTDLNNQISAFQANLNLQEQQLLQTYSQVAVTLQEMPTLLSQTESQLGSLNSSS